MILGVSLKNTAKKITIKVPINKMYKLKLPFFNPNLNFNRKNK
jgi:hypothetical protein